MRLVLVLAVAVVLPLPAMGQTDSSIEMGGTTFYNFGGVSGTSQ